MDEKAYERLAILFALVGDIGYDVNPVPKRIREMVTDDMDSRMTGTVSRSHAMRVGDRQVGLLEIGEDDRDLVIDNRQEFEAWKLQHGYVRSYHGVDMEECPEDLRCRIVDMVTRECPQAVTTEYVTDMTGCSKWMPGYGDVVLEDGEVVPGVHSVRIGGDVTVRGCKANDVLSAARDAGIADDYDDILDLAKKELG